MYDCLSFDTKCIVTSIYVQCDQYIGLLVFAYYRRSLTEMYV